MFVAGCVLMCANDFLSKLIFNEVMTDNDLIM